MRLVPFVFGPPGFGPLANLPALAEPPIPRYPQTRSQNDNVAINFQMDLKSKEDAKIQLNAVDVVKDVNAPEVKAPVVKALEIKTAEVKPSEINASEVKADEIKVPEVKPSEVVATEVKKKNEINIEDGKKDAALQPAAPHGQVQAPDVKAPDVKAEEAEKKNGS